MSLWRRTTPPKPPRSRCRAGSDGCISTPTGTSSRPSTPSGAPLSDGQRSDTVLVTNLANDVQPLIRYELGDSVVIAAEPCPRGSPLPTVTPEGRTDEILKVSSAGGGEVQLLPMAIATVVRKHAGSCGTRSCRQRWTHSPSGSTRPRRVPVGGLGAGPAA